MILSFIWVLVTLEWIFRETMPGSSSSDRYFDLMVFLEKKFPVLLFSHKLNTPKKSL